MVGVVIGFAGAMVCTLHVGNFLMITGEEEVVNIDEYLEKSNKSCACLISSNHTVQWVTLSVQRF